MRKHKKKTKILYLALSIFICFVFSTIAYSAINSTMNISGDAYARVDADVRITSFKLSSSSNVTSHYEEYSKNTVSSNIQLLDDVNSITYDVEVTNYGNVDMGILDITGLPNGLSYELINYNLKDKLCDDTGKCNSFVKKTFQIKITGTPGTYEFVLNFDFRQYHKVTYTNIDGSSLPKYIIDGGDLNITFQENLKRISILTNGIETTYYDSIVSGQTITIHAVSTDIEIKQSYPPAKLISGSLSEPGSLVCIGEECFHVLSNDGSTVTLLARYNLLVGYYVANSEISGLASINKNITPTQLNYILDEDYKVTQLAPEPEPYDNYYSLSNPTGIQDSTAKGYDPNNGFPYIGTIDYSSYSTHYPVYKNYLEYFGVTIKNIRNITLEEIQNLGCSIGTNACPTSLNWLYKSSYWTSTPNYHMNYNLSTDNILGCESSDFKTVNGLRPVIEISINDIHIPQAKIISGNIDTPGAKVCIGDECFYTISSTDDTITMLSKYNLYVGGSYDGTTYTAYGTEATGKQDSSMIGYNPMTSKATGTTAFASSAYWSKTATYPADVFNSNSSLYIPVLNYQNYIKTLGVIPIDSRLITFEELKSLGCDINNKTCTTSSYPFLYSTSYWTGSAYSSSYIYRIKSDGIYSNSGFLYSDNWGYGVRPVITIYKNNTYIDMSFNGEIYKAIGGMTWKEWIESKYNTTGYYLSEDGLVKLGARYKLFTRPNGGYQYVYGTDKIIAGETYEFHDAIND